jgi:tRNA U34 2-thiouridine synthase MnmA/TrmU
LFIYRAYVCGKNMAKKQVFICFGPNHPSLYCDTMSVRNMSWVSGDAPAGLVVICAVFHILIQKEW